MNRAIAALRSLALATIACWGLYGMAAEDCQPVGGFSFICGPLAAEDLVPVPGTHWLIGSGVAQQGKGPGKLHLIDASRKTWEILYPGASPQNDLDAKSYAACPGAPDAKTFSAVGLAISSNGSQTSTILAVNHGREAVEVFKLDAAGAKPIVRWIGCVPMDERTYPNSVAFLPKGGFVVTKLYDPTVPAADRIRAIRDATGGVLEWHPETGLRPIAGTELAGANGIEVSKDGNSFYVAAWGTQELVRFSRGNGPIQKSVVKIDFFPDNLRWAPDGTILVTGQNPAATAKEGMLAIKGWTVAKLDPGTMKITEIAKDNGESPLQYASVAIEVGGTLWIGTARGDRIAYRPAK